MQNTSDVNPILIQTTVEKREDAEILAKILLEKKLVGCAQIQGPVTSSYWWQNSIAQSEEYLLVVKTFERCYPAIENILLSKHPYDVPEIISSSITQISESYLDWLQTEVTG